MNRPPSAVPSSGRQGALLTRDEPSATRLSARFRDYASYHATPGNQVCHMIGIPTIVLAILGLLGHWVIGGDGGGSGSELVRLDAGVLLWAVAMIWYVLMDWRLGLPFSLVTLGFYFAGRAIPAPALWVLFVMGWIFQFIGHYRYEKKAPAFYKNGEHLLVGPFWVFAKVVGYRQA